MSRSLLEYHPEIEALESPVMAFDWKATLSAADEMQHAAELLERVDEGKLEAHLVELIDRAGSTAGRPVVKALADILRRAARRLLQPDGVPPAAEAGRVFGLELEGLSAEDKAFQVARHFVRFAIEAARRAGRAAGAGSPQVMAWRAAASAAQTLAPGLLPTLTGGGRSTSVWFRQGGQFNASNSLPRLAADPGFSSSASWKEPVMHDIDRSGTDYGSGRSAFEAERFEFGEGEWATENGATLSEADEYELATELLGVASEEELDQFLGRLIRRAAMRARKVLRMPVGQAIGGVLKGVARKALPLAGAAVGGFVAGPLGAKIGSGLASAASDEPGTDGEPPEQGQEGQEFEGARQFVRLAAKTVNKAAEALASADPRAAAQSAAIDAARQIAPGLLRKAVSADAAAPAFGRGQSGRWVRREDKIVLYGA